MLSLAGAALLAIPSSANAATPQVTIKVTHRYVVDYVGRCLPADWEVDWMGEGTGVSKVVMNDINPAGKIKYTETAKPGETRGYGWGCVSSDEYGKWTARVTAYDRSGHVLARRSDWYMHRGNTQITSFNASPEPIRAGRTLTVAGRLLHVKFGSAPGYGSYAGKTIRVYFKAAGSKTWKWMGSTTTGRDGRFRRHFTARHDGTWRAIFPGTSHYDGETSPGDYVDVR